jgi:plasmid stability protein
LASITIRKLDETVKARLRIRAARNGRSMEEEAREILKGTLLPDSPQSPNLAQAIRGHVEPLGGVELSLPRRQPVRRPLWVAVQTLRSSSRRHYSGEDLTSD